MSNGDPLLPGDRVTLREMYTKRLPLASALLAATSSATVTV